MDQKIMRSLLALKEILYVLGVLLALAVDASTTVSIDGVLATQLTTTPLVGSKGPQTSVADLYGNTCPSGCECGGSTEIDLRCVGGRSSIPGVVPWGVGGFTYTSNRLPNDSLTREDFTSLTNLSRLDLSDNGIRYIAFDAFTDLDRLVSLIMDNNEFVAPGFRSFLPPVGPRLRVLSVSRVIRRGKSASHVWRLFERRKDDGRGLPTTAHVPLPSLRSLAMDGNGLVAVNADILRNVVAISRQLARISFADNALTGKSIQVLWMMLHRRTRTWENQTVQSPIDQRIGVTARTGLTRITPSIVDLTFNNITGFEKAMFPTPKIWERHLSAAPIHGSWVTFDSPQPPVKMLLRGNPFDCSCAISSGMNFLFRGDGKRVVTDWEVLKCYKPKDLNGLSLQDLDRLQIHYCHIDWGEKDFQLTGAQLAFIVIFGTVLVLVAGMVVYLNRTKMMEYYTYIRNCGKAEDYQSKTIKWKSTLNKYSIPVDHRGVGHKSYYTEEQAIAFETASNEIQVEVHS